MIHLIGLALVSLIVSFLSVLISTKMARKTQLEKLKTRQIELQKKLNDYLKASDEAKYREVSAELTQLIIKNFKLTLPGLLINWILFLSAFFLVSKFFSQISLLGFDLKIPLINTVIPEWLFFYLIFTSLASLLFQYILNKKQTQRKIEKLKKQREKFK